MNRPRIDHGSQIATVRACYIAVLHFFEHDRKKARLWFRTANPLLGDISPRDMVRIGRAWKLARFIRNQIAENYLPGEEPVWLP